MGQAKRRIVLKGVLPVTEGHMAYNPNPGAGPGLSPRAKRFLRRLLALVAFVLFAYLLLIGLWVVLAPRW
jgi:hypothetical protein